MKAKKVPVEVLGAGVDATQCLHAVVEAYTEYKIVADYTQVIKINPDCVEAYLLRGCVYFDLENYQDAVADFTQFIKIQPQDYNAYCYRAKTHIALQNYSDAVVDLICSQSTTES